MPHRFLLLALGTALTAGCAFPERQAASQAAEPSQAAASVTYRNVTVQEARPLIEANPAVVVLDVREPHEFADGHIPGARNLPLGQLDTWAPTLDPAKPYLVVCRSGSRSTLASDQLVARRFGGITNMSGGMLDWERLGHPMER